MKRIYSRAVASLLLLQAGVSTEAQTNINKPAVIAYYHGSPTLIDSFDVRTLTHIIFSFGHLKNGKLSINNAKDTLTIQNLIAQKEKNPALKVMLSLGGWGGCKDCSDAFSTRKGRKLFTGSVKQLLNYFKADGIDLDWEYPAIAGFPGHEYKQEDKVNFTRLVRKLHRKLGNDKIISFAAGGFTEFLTQSIEWKKVMKHASFVNLMTYDLVNGASESTGHHTPLFSTPGQKESGDNAVNYLLGIGIPPGQLVIGAAFYGRLFDSVQNINNGLYQPARFKSYIPGKLIPDMMEKGGYVYFWDDVAKAPYYYNPATQSFLTFENARSLSLKTRYVMEKGLFGIMFWQLAEDRQQDGLLNAISDSLKQ